MIVLKFGGTSVGDAEAIDRAASIVRGRMPGRPAVVVSAIAPALRAVAACAGPLTGAELDAFAARDLAVGRRCIEPVAGVVAGIDASGALLVDVGSPRGRAVSAVRAGSLILEEMS